MRSLARGVLLTLLLLALGWPAAARAQEQDEDLGSYGLDELPRTVDARGTIRCPTVELVRFAGGRIRYQKPVTVYAGFVERLRRFDAIVEETAVEVYGRAPRRIRHLGAFNCRRIRTYPTFLSEHGLGNGIDIEGFDFAPARGKAERAATPAGLKGAFQVRVDKHWLATRGPAALHARFLHLLTERLVARPDVFRVLLGPAYPGHKNHFHFDVSPWRIVEL